MRRRDSRENLPWPAAPIPPIPTFTKELDSVEVIDRLGRWHGELEHFLHIWRRRDVTFYRRLPRIEEQIRLCLQRTAEYLPDGIGTDDGFHGWSRESLMGECHELLGRALSESNDPEKDAEAVREFKQAMALEPGRSKYWYSYVRHLIVKGNIQEALKAINAVEYLIVARERESLANHIVNWALAHPEIGTGISPDVIKQCISLVSLAGTGLLIRGCPLPHPPPEKWRRTEILRVLWAGMQCSVPVDELCQREGIDRATYYRWRKRYLPPEWGAAPALV